MKKIMFLLFGIVSYLVFLGAILYAIGFVGNLVVPKTIDGKPQAPLASAILTNAALLFLFVMQQSIMVRPSFKQSWTRIIPTELERSSFVLLSSICPVFIMWQWQPIGGIIWSVKNEMLNTVLHIAYLTGWAIVFVSTFLINHFDLFGLRKVWLYFKGQPYSYLPSRLPGLYRLVRHPLYLGFLVAFWATPVMTVAHLVLAILTTGYILTAIRFEDRDLIVHFGEKYNDYKTWAPMLIPFSKRRASK
jgi:protein-S-isoprenylcysteine O-methyltransferase Ste14